MTPTTLRNVTTAAVLALVVLLVIFAFDLALLLFAAVLIAVVLHGAAIRVARITHLPRGLALAIVIVAILGVIAGIVAFALPALMSELAQLRERLPEAMDKLQELIDRFTWLETIIDALPKGDVAGSYPGIAGRVSSTVTSTLGSLVNTVVVLLVGIYLAVDPDPYIDATVRLFPKRRRERVREVLCAVGAALFHWIQGQLVGMAVIGVATAIGLLLIGIPLAGTLGVIAGLLEFVPNLGPILSAVPAVLIGSTVDASHALYVVILYIVIQHAESYLLMPYVMRRAVALPPAMTIVAQLIGTLVGGLLGLLLATPITAACVVLVQKAYLEDVLGEADAQKG